MTSLKSTLICESRIGIELQTTLWVGRCQNSLMSEFWQRPTHSVVCSSIPIRDSQMSVDFNDVINTRLQPGATRRPCRSTGLTSGVNKTAASTRLWLLVVLVAFSMTKVVFAAQPQDAEYDAVAEEYVKTYLAAHPLQGTALGLHEYDGKISDYSRLALDAELSRLRRFEDRLAKFDPAKLSPRQSIRSEEH